MSAPEDALTTFIANEPGMAQRLLAQHVDDGTGRCKCCSAGAQTSHYPWPCMLARHAAAAAALRDGR